ncbi:FAM96A [Blepharisma stoltei]|uniref:MIP18 family-like domain-containing protein n=1 Tax=Blepharisma stoltei TaxID=1481888 RepID=A0AAU9JCH9_9CILI|nr:unnamed protein product [Blepharisma stoltei]
MNNKPKYDPEFLKEMIMDAIGNIQDPELPNTLEDLDIVAEDRIEVKATDSNYHATIVWIPTKSTCSYANNIALCMRYKLQEEYPDINLKLDIILKEGSHVTKMEIDKQVNDKERIAAALENPDVLQMIKKSTGSIYEH